MSVHRPAPQSVLRVIGILELLSGTATGETLSSLARALHAPKNSLVTLLAGLIDAGYVTRDEQARYRIGPASFALGSRLTGGTKLPGLVRPALQRLVDATGETAIAGVLSPAEDSMIYVDKSESRNPMRYTAAVGEHRELYCTALGRLALAYMTPELQQRCLASLKLEPVTGSTITSRRALTSVLRQVRASGVSVVSDERIVGASGIAAPLLSPAGKFIAGIAIIGPSPRILPRIADFSRAVSLEARNLSQLIASAPGAFDSQSSRRTA